MRRWGFSLAEALVSMGLLTLGLLLVLSLFPRVVLQQKQLSYRTMAVELASNAIHEALQKDATALPAGSHALPAAVLPGGISMTGELVVSEVTSGLRSLEVVIHWQERSMNLEYRQKQRAFHVSY